MYGSVHTVCRMVWHCQVLVDRNERRVVAMAGETIAFSFGGGANGLAGSGAVVDGLDRPTIRMGIDSDRGGLFPTL